MGYRRILSLLLLVIAAGGCATAATADNERPELPDKVLFVGNSFTYYNNGLHRQLRHLTWASGLLTPANSRMRIMTISGGHLPEHAGGFEKVLAGDDWDVVVLQGHSLGPIREETAGPFRQAAREFAAKARARGARPVFYMTWAYSGQPEMTALLDEAYTGIGRELGAEVAPVGLAFARVTKERPDIVLRTEDDRHPTMAGTYLAACVFFATLYGQSPEGLDYDAGLPPATAAYLQRIAGETVENYPSREGKGDD